MPEFQYVDEPPKIRRAGGRPGLWCLRLGPLTERPQQWARVRVMKPDTARRTAYLLRKGELTLPFGTTTDQWDVVARVIGGEGHIFARYTGRRKQFQAPAQPEQDNG